MRGAKKPDVGSDQIHVGGGGLYRLAIRYMIDGEWYDIERVVQYLIPKVHPAKAARRAERQRLGVKGRGFSPPTDRYKNKDIDRIIRIGARSMARETLRNRAMEVDFQAQKVRIRPNKLAHAKKVVDLWTQQGGEAAFHDIDIDGE